MKPHRENSAGAATAQSTATMEHEDEGSPGVSDAQVLFGQSAAFTGPARELGRQMRLGIEAAFHEANQAGGVHGRLLKIEALDDAYEDEYAHTNTERLIENQPGIRPHRSRRYAHLPSSFPAGALGRGTLSGPIYRRRVSARPTPGQRAQLPRLLLPGNRGDGGPSHGGSETLPALPFSTRTIPTA